MSDNFFLLDNALPDSYITQALKAIPPEDDARWTGGSLSGEGPMRVGRGRSTRFPSTFSDELEDVIDEMVETARVFVDPSHELTVDWGYAGAFQVLPGFALSPHVDTTQSKVGRLFHRTHNVLLYLTSHEGEDAPLELWGPKGIENVISPQRNRLVVFPMSATSWHGHPKPAKQRRLSLACNLAAPYPKGTKHEVTAMQWWADR